MFQALFFQERDAMHDLIAHKNDVLTLTMTSREAPPRSPNIDLRTFPDAAEKKDSTETMFAKGKSSTA